MKLRPLWLALAVALPACSSPEPGPAPPAPAPVAVVDEGETLLVQDENAYDPLPSPDGTKVAYVRARWGRHGLEGDQSRFDSEIVVVDPAGRVLTPRALAETFTNGWTPDGQDLVCYRDGLAFLVALDGKRTHELQLPPHETGGVPERAAWLPSSNQFVVAHAAEGETQLLLGDGRLVARHPSEGPPLGEMIVPSPDERYLAVLDAQFVAPVLRVVDRQTGRWTSFGTVVVYPQGTASHWDALKPTWNPWFPDSSRLVFATAEDVVVATPDGKSREVLVHLPRPEGPDAASERPGLPVPSPDGQNVAFVTLDLVPRRDAPGKNNFENTTVWVVPAQAGAKPRALTRKAEEATLSIAWLGPHALLFDRVSWIQDDPRKETAQPRARIFKVALPGNQ